jgi:hypothetical protein
MSKNINNILALMMLIVVFPILWILDGSGIIKLPGEVLGATIAAFTLIIQFYFRKRSSSEPPKT